MLERVKNIESIANCLCKVCNRRKYAHLENESTSAWLERLVAVGAPVDVRANVQAILAAETRQFPVQPAGKQY